MTYDLLRLQAELADAGIIVPALGMDVGKSGATLYTYSETGEIIDLPPEAQAVIDAHVPPEPETPPTEILLALLQDVTDVDETKPILEAMLLILGGQT